jgi:hypothetical protein
MPIVGRSLCVLLAASSITSCAPGPKEVRMADPRTGVVAICRPGQSDIAKPDSILAAVIQADPCVEELSYYGFQDEEALLAAAKPR